MFVWHNETTLKSFGRLSVESSEPRGNEAGAPLIEKTAAEGAKMDPPADGEETLITVRPLDA